MSFPTQTELIALLADGLKRVSCDGLDWTVTAVGIGGLYQLQVVVTCDETGAVQEYWIHPEAIETLDTPD